MTDFENRVAGYFLNLTKEDDNAAEQKTLDQFDIDQETLDYILQCHILENF